MPGLGCSVVKVSKRAATDDELRRQELSSRLAGAFVGMSGEIRDMVSVDQMNAIQVHLMK